MTPRPLQDNKSPARDHKVFAELVQQPDCVVFPSVLSLSLCARSQTHTIEISRSTTGYYNIKGLCLLAARMLNNRRTLSRCTCSSLQRGQWKEWKVPINLVI